MKTALITGAGRGIGRAVCVELAKQGYTLFIVSKSKDALAKTKQLCTEAGATVYAALCDVREEDSVYKLKDKVIQTLGTLGLLINCAAVGHEKSASDEATEDLQRIMDTNFYGSVYFTKAFLPHLLENNGQVVFVYPETLSQAHRSSYCASKSALSAYGESLAEEMSESNVKVSNVYLPPVTSNLFKETAQSGNLTREEAGRRLLSEIGLIEGSSTSSSE